MSAAKSPSAPQAARSGSAPALAFALALVVAAAATGCNAPAGGSGSSTGSNSEIKPTDPPDSSVTDPTNPPVDPAPAPETDVLLFNGAGVSTSDWQSTESIIKSQGWTYELANSAQLNAMTAEKLATFGVIVVPGGSGGTIYSNLTVATRLKVRKAVQDSGVGYVGFCAGAWVAVGPEADTDQTAGYGMAIAPGAVLDLYYPNGQQPTAAMVSTSFPDGSKRQLVWWGGPITPEWSHGVVARYSSGEPAISQTFSGKGLVEVSGPHPEAPQGWRATAGYDSDGLDTDLAVALIQAALKKAPLSVF